jgi:YD repeat-containing protein
MTIKIARTKSRTFVVALSVGLAMSLFLAAAASAVTYQYDKENRLTRATYPGGQQVNYTYDAAGNLLTQTISGADTRGTVRIRVVPSTASWVFTDGTGVAHAGTGNQDVANVPVGRVDVFWQPLTGAFPPQVNPAVGILAAGVNLTIQGIYAVEPMAVKIWSILD